jgi:hypothetical protein
MRKKKEKEVALGKHQPIPILTGNNRRPPLFSPQHERHR